MLAMSLLIEVEYIKKNKWYKSKKKVYYSEKLQYRLKMKEC
jgi:hypothetical protein